MTQIQPPRETSPPQPRTPPEATVPVEPGPSTGRLVGVDLARALAVFGMFVIHIGPAATDVSGVGAWVRGLAEGRSSALFATLAGFSLMLIAGRLEPKTGLAGRRAKARIAIRAVVLLALGTVMAMAYGGVVILAFYAVYFLLALPLVRLRARTLAIIAAALAVVMPPLAFGLKSLLTEPIMTAVKAYDPLDRIGGVGVLDLLVTGFYPAIPWMAFVIAGMALGRLDLSAGTVRRRLAMVGPGLIVFAYGTSWLLSQLFDGVRKATEGQASAMLGSGSKPKPLGSGADMAPADGAGSAWTLLTSGPHTGMTFDIIGSVGVAITVLVCAMVATDRLAWLRRLATPIIAVGTMSLTAYVGHFVVAPLVSLSAGPEGPKDSWVPVLLFIVGTCVFAWVWSRFFRRGPLEFLLNAATKPVKYLR